MFSIAVLLLLITTAAAFAQSSPYVGITKSGNQKTLIVPEQPTKSTIYTNNDLAILSDGNIYYFVTYGKDITIWKQTPTQKPYCVHTMPGKTVSTPISTMLAFVLDKSDVKNSKQDLYSKN